VKILVVEDEAPIRNNLAILLRMEGFEVLEAPNGKVGLEMATEQLPDLILSDVMMPELDGYQMLAQLRANPVTAAIPLIFLSARTDRTDIRHGMNLGADDYIGKPFAREEVISAITARIKRKTALGSSMPVQKAKEQTTQSSAAAETGNETPDIKGYRIIRKIGSGGMSQVYLAWRESDGLQVALKVLDTHINRSEDLLQRFIQEYALLAQIDHPNVVKIYDQGVADEHAFLTMEYFSGGDIKSRIAGGVPAYKALDITMQVAQALAQIHAHGIVHRDVKPDNLMRRADGSIVLIDFGVAKHMDQELAQTLHGEIVGSPYYLSPEQAGGRPVTAASDIYCLGVIFYEMLTGSRPYSADSIESLLAHHLFTPPPRLEEKFSIYQGLLDKMMDKEPSRRFENAMAVADYIQRHHGNAGAV
jgi:DNA-binding response OmpR family regulator